MYVCFFTISEHHNNTISMSNISEINDLETTDEQRQNNTEMESFCREVTKCATGEDGKRIEFLLSWKLSVLFSFE